MPHSLLLVIRLLVGAICIAALVQIDGGPRYALLGTSNDPAQRAQTIARSQPSAADETALAAQLNSANQLAAYVGYPDGPARPGEWKDIAVAVRNQSSETWHASGQAAVKLSYHVYDGSGRLLAWDGLRTTLPFDIPPGGGDVIPMKVAVPAHTGTYTVKPDLIRDGVAWFSSIGAVPGAFHLKVTTDLDVGYGPSTTPASIVPGAEVPVEIQLTNTGLRPWPAGGSNPVRLAYHWYDSGGTAVVWDGPRSQLPHDIAPGAQISLAVSLRAPDGEGTYTLGWDMVQEGVGWFSDHAVPMKGQAVAVQEGVTLYGKGWGHGIGLSQWGAQGWAQGASGVRLNGEQIVAHYFPGSHLATQPITQPFRVLLSAPSTGCIARTIYSVARMHSEGGMRLVNDADPSIVYFESGVNQPLRFWVHNSSLIVTDEWGREHVYIGDGTVRLIPTQWWDPITIDQKDLAYRGDIVVQVRDGDSLRVVNYVSSDDYMRGALPGEMPSWWEFEALRAQAIAARTYAAWRQSTAGDRTWDVRDDTADQCYGGHSFESARTSAVVEATSSLILTYEGKPIRALYSSASGGVSENVGCVLDAERVGGTWQCVKGWPYLQVTDDPAEAAAYDKRGDMPHGLWAEHFSGDVIRREIIVDYGMDIGSFVSMEFNMSPGGRPISVRVRGTYGVVDLKGDRFMRTTLGLKSTLVRTTPF